MKVGGFFNPLNDGCVVKSTQTLQTEILVGNIYRLFFVYPYGSVVFQSEDFKVT